MEFAREGVVAPPAPAPHHPDPSLVQLPVLDLPGPSRRIVVEPVEAPELPVEVPEREREPAAPDREPDRSPGPVPEPAPEKTPA